MKKAQIDVTICNINTVVQEVSCMESKERIAKIIRALSVPPVMVSVLIIILAINKDGIFRNTLEIVVSIVLLGFVPILAYILNGIVPGFRKQGREGQRKLAFVTNLIGYSVAFLWALLSDVESALLLICSTYFFSVLILTICNKAFHYRASGHACSFTGPLVLMIYFFGWKVFIPCLLVAALIIWSSIYLKRHTAKELIGGIVVCLFSFALSLFLITLV